MSSESSSDPKPDAQSPATGDDAKTDTAAVAVEDGKTKSSSAAPSYPAAKMAAVTAFLGMVNPFGQAKNEPEFPPSEWGVTGAKNSGAGASQWDYDLNRWKGDIEELKGFVKEEQRKEAEAAAKASQNEEKQEEKPQDTVDPPQEPETLARRVRTMLENLYPSTAPETSPTRDKPTTVSDVTEPVAESHPATTDEPLPTESSKQEDPPVGEGKPLGRSSSISRMFPGLDWKTRTALFSETVMNGAEKGKESVFAILEQMNTRKAGDGTDTKAEEPHRDGVMVYAPLNPDDDSVAELADSDTVDADESKDGEAAKTRREWHPSPTKLSLQATWWGYRLYLPPPVLAVLSDAHLTAVKRGALISASLKWLLDQIPLVLVPVPLKPSVAILKRLSPYLGYVGAFVAWSWEKIKSKDQGNGVVLSATWACPVALVPASWDYETHGHPQAPTPKTKKSIFTRAKSSKGEKASDAKKGSTEPTTAEKGKAKAADEVPKDSKK